MNIKLPIKPIRMPAVLKLTGLSRSTIRTLEKKGDFPKRMYLSVRCVAWEAEEVDEWLKSVLNQERHLSVTPNVSAMKLGSL